MGFKHFLLGAALGTLPLFTLADGTIVDGAVSLDYEVGEDVDDGNTTINGINGNDHIYGIHFLYRIEGDTAESTLLTPTLEDYSGNVATLSWSDVDSRGQLDIQVTMTLNESGTDSAEILFNTVLTNIDAVPVTVDFFLYIDPDLDGSSGSDSGELITLPSHIRVFETTEFNFVASGNDAYQVTEYSDLADSLDDGAITDLDNTGLPFGPEDITLAFQWSDRVINPGDDLVIDSGTGANTEPALPVPPPVPVPALPLSALLLTLLAIILQVRQRRPLKG